MNRNGALKSRPRNSTMTRNQRATEKEERERLRAEQASRRKGRAERRRADGMSYMAGSILVKVSEAHQGDTDSDPSEELPLAARATVHKVAINGVSPVVAVLESAADPAPISSAEAPPSSQPAPDTPPAVTVPVSTTKVEKRRSHKKKGRNQYTRDRDDDVSPARSQSRDIKDDQAPKHGEGSAKSHPRSKGGMSSKVTITDMKRRATALLNFITQTQMELAAEDGLSTEDGKSKDSPGSSAEKTVEKNPREPVDGPAASKQNGESNSRPIPGKEFKELNCLEMMDRLTTRLVKWQQEYGA